VERGCREDFLRLCQPSFEVISNPMLIPVGPEMSLRRESGESQVYISNPSVTFRLIRDLAFRQNRDAVRNCSPNLLDDK